ncbi:putative WD repeat-containing protein-like [Heracleum sosnowskyi]|uniref:WD repeat-containing protein-like n=1 Tax=Heracleum sosnowskyi TaxID=360622 RepID=A0AAD8HI71_9APIA|nr:putative WD repeat-containing protein-like [Heracleum sosnowskyi]
MTTKTTAGEIEESTSPTTGNDNSDESSPLLSSLNAESKTLSTQKKVPEVEINLLRRGRGPIAVFKSRLGGFEQDQLDVREILEKYNFKSIHAFNSITGRGAPIRFYPRSGLSLIPYTDGAVIAVDGEPKDSVINPITRIVVGVAVMMLLIVFVMKETPHWAQNLNFSGGYFPPWALALVIVVFTRLRKRTKDFLLKRGW